MAYIKLGNMGRKRPIQDEEGGSGLPEVTSADEGKVLSVNSSGEWAAELPVVFVNVIAVSATKLRLDKTFEELQALAEARKVIYVVFNEIANFNNGYFLLAEVSTVNSQCVVSFMLNGSPITFTCGEPDQYPEWVD